MTTERKQKSEPQSVPAEGGIAQVSMDAESPIAQGSLKAKRGKHRKVRIQRVYDWSNLRLAYKEAARGKNHHYGVRKFNRYWWKNMTDLQDKLVNGTYHTGTPTIEERFCDGKVRALAKLHFNDHVVHHACMQVVMPTLLRSYYYESSASIIGRGIHYSVKHIKKFLYENRNKDLWWAQIDFVKFYHHIKRGKIYERFCRTFGDEGVRMLFKDIIWSLGNHNGIEESGGTEGMGIGFYPVQPLVNYYMNDFDRKVAALKGIKMYRYCDNVLLVGTSAKAVWDAILFVDRYASEVLCQPIHTNIGVQKLDDVHPLNFVGYLFYKDHTLVRKSTKKKFKLKYKQYRDDPEKLKRVLSSYKGWLMHADGLHLWHTVTGMQRFSDLNIDTTHIERDGVRYFDVPTVNASFLINRTIIVKDFIENVTTKNGDGRMCVLVNENGTDRKFLTNNPRLKEILLKIREMNALPFEATLRSRQICGNKTDYYFE